MGNINQRMRMVPTPDGLRIEWRVTGAGRSNKLLHFQVVPRGASKETVAEAIASVVAEGRKAFSKDFLGV